MSRESLWREFLGGCVRGSILAVISLGLTALLFGGCADPLRQSATAALQSATACVRSFEQFDHDHKRAIEVKIKSACVASPVGPERSACVSRESAALASYFEARKPAMLALGALGLAEVPVRVAVDSDGPAPVDLGELVAALVEEVGKVTAFVAAMKDVN